MTKLCDACRTAAAESGSRCCRYCALQAPAAGERDSTSSAPSADASCARWALVGDVLLAYGIPAFVGVFVVAAGLLHG